MKGLLGHLKFSKFKYKNEVYSVGEKVLISDEGSDCSIAKIVKIVPTKGINSNNYWPSIVIEWYYRKCDLLKDADHIANFKADFISDYELFESHHRDTVFIESIVGKCSVVSFDEFENSTGMTGIIYFSRAKYDPIKVNISYNLDDYNTPILKMAKDMHMQRNYEPRQSLCSM